MSDVAIRNKRCSGSVSRLRYYPFGDLSLELSTLIYNAAVILKNYDTGKSEDICACD